MGANIPPADTTGVDELRTAWAKCPTNCRLLLWGGLNIDFRAMQTEREDIIDDLLDKINIVNMLRIFFEWCGWWHCKGLRWTWLQQRGDNIINPSQIAAWPGKGTQISFRMWPFSFQGSTTWIIVLSPYQFWGDIQGGSRNTNAAIAMTICTYVGKMGNYIL